jgi:ATP-dependent phosphofructokinase / diphosphate-dependent phosphofructokinase
VPKTIDNDIVRHDELLRLRHGGGFATDAIDRLHTTAEAHRRIMVVEVMGRYAGWIALHAGWAGGADVVLIPEIPYDLEKVAQTIRERERRGPASTSSWSPRGQAQGRRDLDRRAGRPRQGVERLGGAGQRVRTRWRN